MMDWIRRYQSEISYFIAGWCALGALQNLAQGDYVWAAINAGLVWLNIRFAKN